jgi:hypothetical protein
MEKTMYGWADETLTRMAQDGRRAVLIFAIDRRAQRVTGYYWGGAAAPLHGSRIQRHSVEDPDGMGAALASEVWQKSGCVMVSVWDYSHHKERQFESPQALGGVHAFQAWMLNMLQLEAQSYVAASVTPEPAA